MRANLSFSLMISSFLVRLKSYMSRLRGLKSQIGLTFFSLFAVQILDFERHADFDVFGFGTIHSLDSCIHPRTLLQFHHPGTLGIFLVIPLGDHKRRWNVDTGKSGQTAPAFHLDPFHLRSEAIDANRPRRDIVNTAAFTPRAHKFFFI